MAVCYVDVSLNVCLKLPGRFADMTEEEQEKVIRGCLLILGEERLLECPLDWDFEEEDEE